LGAAAFFLMLAIDKVAPSRRKSIVWLRRWWSRFLQVTERLETHPNSIA